MIAGGCVTQKPGMSAVSRRCPRSRPQWLLPYYALAGVKKEEMNKELGHFENNAPRMRYKWFRSRGLFTGSGSWRQGARRSPASTSSNQA